MKTGKLLVDANAVVHYLNNDNEIISKIDNCESLFVPVIVWGELLFGAQNSNQTEKNITRLETFMLRTTILVCDRETGIFYSAIRSGCKKIGKPIPENDLWIAAISLQYKLPMITRDKHFDAIPNLQLVSW